MNDMKGNTKALYKLTNNLTGNEISNPMPPGKTDEQLANEFAKNFLQKINETATWPHVYQMGPP